MCGINGFTWNDSSLIEKMNNVLRYRGPDDEGAFHDSNVSLGHRRLSIIDLSEAGHQPMTNADESLWIVYNGEVYNFREIRSGLIDKGYVFKSDCDTEVVLAAYQEYGIKCLDMFNGMWAFAIYDKTNSKLILARDRFGIKPLYYYQDESQLIFSSMIGGILCHNIKTSPNDSVIMQYLAYGLIHHDSDTFFDGIQSLKPGHCISFDLDSSKLAIEKWYIPEKAEIRSGSEKDSVRKAFAESVKWRTVSDVPVGGCLSGGIDSSSIVSLLDTSLSYPFKTYSFILPGHKLDESAYIKEMGRTTNTEQFFTSLDDETFLKDIEDLVETQEEPIPSLAIYAQYKVMECAAKQKTKVLLDGQGGDELFAGYVYYFAYRYYELLKRGRFFKLINEIISYTINFRNLMPQSMFLFLFLSRRLKKLIFKKFINQWINHAFLEKYCTGKTDPRWEKMSVDQALQLTLESTAIPHLLRWEDKNSMRWGIESRIPFLDIELVRTASVLPSHFKLKKGKTKIVFKQAVEKLLPPLILNRKDKIGFGTQENEFFRNEKIVAYCKDIIYSQSFKTRPYWIWEKVEEIYCDYISGKNNNGRLVMKWVCMELWLRKYFG